MVKNDPRSPDHFGLSGTFSADDIQELLGAMGEEQQRQQVDEAPAPASLLEAPISSDDGIGEEAKAQARSERKRSREKQRRSDINKQFADLTQILRQIEAEDSEEDKVRLSFNPSNRVDLIARTILHLERLRDFNKKKKEEIESLQQQLDLAKKAGEDTAQKLKETMFNHAPPTKQVMMMVPMMMPSDGSSNFAAAMGGAMGGAMPMMNNMMSPFMIPQPFMPSQIPNAAPAPTPQQPPVAAPQQPMQQQQPQTPAFPSFAVQPQTATLPQPQQMQMPLMAQAPQNSPQQPQQLPIQNNSFMMHTPQVNYGHIMPAASNVQATPPASVNVPATVANPVVGSLSSDSSANTGEAKRESIQGGSNMAHCA